MHMCSQRSQEWVIKKYWPEGSYDKVQPVGPSPVLIHLDQLKAVYQRWLDSHTHSPLALHWLSK